MRLEAQRPSSNPRFGPIGQNHWNQEETKTKTQPRYPVGGAGGKQLSRAEANRDHPAAQCHVVKQKTGRFHREAPTINRLLRLQAEVRGDQDHEANYGGHNYSDHPNFD
jgi:hypothetical protein